MCINNSRIADATLDLATSLLSTLKRQLEETRALLDDPQFVQAAGKIDEIATQAKRLGTELTIYQWIELRRVIMINEQKCAKVRRAIKAVDATVEQAIVLVTACGSFNDPQLAAARRVQSAVDALCSLFATEAVGCAVWQDRTNRSVLTTLDTILDELSALSGTNDVPSASSSTHEGYDSLIW